jgi:hypothetical protein
MAIIKFHIKNGEVKIEVDGVIGETCKNITKVFEERLGTILEVNEKPEYYEVVEQNQIEIGT